MCCVNQSDCKNSYGDLNLYYRHIVIDQMLDIKLHITCTYCFLNFRYVGCENIQYNEQIGNNMWTAFSAVLEVGTQCIKHAGAVTCQFSSSLHLTTCIYQYQDRIVTVKTFVYNVFYKSCPEKISLRKRLYKNVICTYSADMHSPQLSAKLIRSIRRNAKAEANLNEWLFCWKSLEYSANLKNWSKLEKDFIFDYTL
jgi:hypothetical protein